MNAQENSNTKTREFRQVIVVLSVLSDLNRFLSDHLKNKICASFSSLINKKLL